MAILCPVSKQENIPVSKEKQENIPASKQENIPESKEKLTCILWFKRFPLTKPAFLLPNTVELAKQMLDRQSEFIFQVKEEKQKLSFLQTQNPKKTSK